MALKKIERVLKERVIGVRTQLKQRVWGKSEEVALEPRSQ